MANLMPDGIVFERANSNMITRHFEINSQAWAGPLSVSAYLDLQHKLADTEASRGQTAYWVLRLAEDPLGLISSCTTYMRDAIVTKGQGTRTTKAIVITDIFTHPEHRMCGMAELLLKNVRDRMDKENFSNAEFSIIYGDIHSGLFQRLGWKPVPATQLRISVSQLKLQERREINGIRYVDFSEIMALAAEDSNTSKMRLSGHRDGITHAQILPTHWLTRWHLIRSRLFGQHLSRGKKDIQIQGAISISEMGMTAWAWWVHNHRARQLCIGRLYMARRKGIEATVRKLLEAAVVEASLCGIREVVIWDPSEQVVDAAGMLSQVLGEKLVISNEDRHEMVPYLRWKDGKECEVAIEDKDYYAWS